jgi:hypothetical protein
MKKMNKPKIYVVIELEKEDDFIKDLLTNILFEDQASAQRTPKTESPTENNGKDNARLRKLCKYFFMKIILFARQTAKVAHHLWAKRRAFAVAAFVIVVAILLVPSRLGPGPSEMMNAFIHADKPIQYVLIDGKPVEGEIISYNQRRMPLSIGKQHRISIQTSDGYEYPPKSITIEFEGQPVKFKVDSEEIEEAHKNE